MLENLDRVIGIHEGSGPGPLLVIVGGVHGNEPAGVLAARNVLEVLAQGRIDVRGKVLALVGNVQALTSGDRFIDEDLNRIWTANRIEQVRRRGASNSEEGELLELLAQLEAWGERTSEQGLVLLDLHSTSADGSPFSIMSDTVQNRTVGMLLPIPVILGLEERIEGTMLSHISSGGHIAVCVEGGQHDLTSTVLHHEAAIWLTLEAAGLVAREDVPERGEHVRRLERAADGLPRVLEIRYHHLLEDGEDFQMLEGYTNFDPVREHQVLANSYHTQGETVLRREVSSPISGLVLMPRYQALGNDGFFVGRQVRPFWLKLSAFLRRWNLDALLVLLPGVRRSADRRNVLRVNPRVARWGVLPIFHLFGYRRHHRRDTHLYFVRRPDRFR